MRKIKSILAVVLVACMMLSVASCAKSVKKVDKDKFEAALEKVKIDDDDLYENKNGTRDGYDYDRTISAYDGNCIYVYIEFEDADECKEYFDDEIYDEFEDLKKDKDFDGKLQMHTGAHSGYVIFNGEADGDDVDGDVYGGIYFRDNVLVMVMCYSDKKSDIEDIQTVLKALGLPRP